MANPDRAYDFDNNEGQSGWFFNLVVLLIVLFNIFVIGNYIVAHFYPPYKDSGIFKLVDDMIFRPNDNSPQCRYEGDCTP